MWIESDIPRKADPSCYYTLAESSGRETELLDQLLNVDSFLSDRLTLIDHRNTRLGMVREWFADDET